jgi:hypothetical protein
VCGKDLCRRFLRIGEIAMDFIDARAYWLNPMNIALGAGAFVGVLVAAIAIFREQRMHRRRWSDLGPDAYDDLIPAGDDVGENDD